MAASPQSFNPAQENRRAAALFNNTLWNYDTADGVAQLQPGDHIFNFVAKAHELIDINDEGTIYGVSVINADLKYTDPLRPGMVWKRTAAEPSTYAPPSYFYPQYPFPAVFGGRSILGSDWFMNNKTIGAIANDGTINSFTGHNVSSNSWMTYNSAAFDSTVASSASMQSVKALNGTIDTSKTFPGAILDKDRALFVETTTLNTGVDDCKLWLKEEATQTDLSFMTPQSVSMAEMSYTPNLKSDASKRLWVTTGSSVYLEKRAGGTGVGRWHQPPSMQIGASLLHSSGIALKGSEILTSGETTLPWLWRNGKYTGLNNPSLTSKPTAVEITDVIDIASNGIILAEAKEGQVKKTGLLYPVQIRGYPTEQGEDDIGMVNGIYLKEKKRKLVNESPGDPDDTTDTDFKTEAKTKLKIAQLGNDYVDLKGIQRELFTSDSVGNCTFVHGAFKNDLDIFRIRLSDLPIPAPDTEHRVKIWTTTINGSTVLDPGAEVKLNIFHEDPLDDSTPVKFHESAALALVADTAVEGTEETDDSFAVETKADGTLGDRTYRAVLGGVVKFKWLTAPGQPEFEIPVIDGRDVHVTGFVMPGGADKAKATRWFKRAKEIYSAIGVNLIYDFKELDEVPDGVNLNNGFTIPTETTEHLSVMQPETIALMSNPACQVAPGTIPVFFVTTLIPEDVAVGYSNVHSSMAPGNAGYGGAIFIDSGHTKVSVLAHELTHILLDAGHQPSPNALWNYDFTGKKCYVWWGNMSQGNGTWTETGINAHRRFRDSMRSRILKSKYVNP